MGEKVTIPVEFDLDVVREYQRPGTAAKDAAGYEREADALRMPFERIHAAAKAAVLRFELPWEPSEQDVTDYVEAIYGRSTSMSTRRRAAEAMKAHRRNGWDTVPRRLGDTPA